MYPKQSQSKFNHNDEKKQAKREQLAQLLINKFRNKYAVNPTTERDLDTLIQDEELTCRSRQGY